MTELDQLQEYLESIIEEILLGHCKSEAIPLVELALELVQDLKEKE